MAIFIHEGVGIRGLAAAVPSRIFDNYRDNIHFSTEDAKAIVDKTGIFQRRVAAPKTCASDLCFAAGDSLINGMQLDRSEIDMLIFVSQTPDFRMPATAILLQERLGLPKSCAAFDINLGCSGFVYGLNLAFSLVKQPGIRKILLLNGETRTKVYSFKDRQTGFLFGDAGTACLVEKGEEFGTSRFILDSDGAKSDYIKINSGGYRNPSSPDSLLEKTFDDGSIRTDEQGFMDGAGVFEFVITQVPKQIKEILRISEKTTEEIDHFVFHQANQFMNDHLVKKLKLQPEKVPFCLDRYGNTSSVSIPLTIVSELSDKLSGSTKQLLLSGFGVGLSMGSAVVKVCDPFIGPISEI
jgi:3-oxoacyl-[acyl-carrier-protein] synthase-3